MRKINKRDASLPTQRIYEVEFYYYIKKLLVEYDHSVIIFDLIDAFATLGEVDATLVKKLVRDIITNTGNWQPSRKESYVIYKKYGLSIRQIYNKIGMAPNTQKAVDLELKANPTQRPLLAPRLSEEVYLSLRTLMDQISKFKGV